MINENYRTKKTSIFIQKKLTEICSFKINAYLCTRFQEQKSFKKRAFSSAGSEHLPYKQRVGGSNPSTPTRNSEMRLPSSTE